MTTRNRYICVVLFPLALAACGSTSRFIAQPSLTTDVQEEDARKAAATLFDAATPYSIKLCEASQTSKQCTATSEGISASGVGGLFLPLRLHVAGMTISKQARSDDGWSFDASLDSKVDSVAPHCRPVHGQIVSRNNNTLSMQLDSFYCNWLVVGNVMVNAELSIDGINSKEHTFTGFYKMTFHGTGNAAGSGYYKAEIALKDVAMVAPPTP
jgi:hypothetical protein